MGNKGVAAEVIFLYCVEGKMVCEIKKSSETASPALRQNGRSFSPNDMLLAHSTQQGITAARANRAMKSEFRAHFFFTRPA